MSCRCGGTVDVIVLPNKYRNKWLMKESKFVFGFVFTNLCRGRRRTRENSQSNVFAYIFLLLRESRFLVFLVTRTQLSDSQYPLLANECFSAYLNLLTSVTELFGSCQFSFVIRV